MAALKHLAEGLHLKISLNVKMEESIINSSCTEQHVIMISLPLYEHFAITVLVNRHVSVTCIN
jgi:hypothetical protein